MLWPLALDNFGLGTGIPSCLGEPAHPPALLLRVNWGADVERIFRIYPRCPSVGGKGILGPSLQDLEPWVGQQATLVGLEAGRDLQVTGIKGQANFPP